MASRTLASAPPNLTMHPPCVATARCRLAARPLVWLPPSSPPPFIMHLVAFLRSTHLSPVHGLTTVTLESSSVLCRNRCAILVVLIVFGVLCHAQMTHQDACQAEFADCQAVAEDVVPLAAETGTPSSESEGALERRRFARHACTQPQGRCACACQPVPCRVTCTRRQEHERRSAAGRHRAVPRVERNELRSEAAGLSSAQPCAHGRNKPG